MRQSIESPYISLQIYSTPQKPAQAVDETTAQAAHTVQVSQATPQRTESLPAQSSVKKERQTWDRSRPSSLGPLTDAGTVLFVYFN